MAGTNLKPLMEFFAENDGIPRCDFCSKQPVLWNFPAKEFESPSIPGVIMDGHWAACQICHDLIVAGKYEDLLERSVKTAPALLREACDIEQTRIGIRITHQMFRANRLGDPVRYGGQA